jgi:hypothetical protein
MAAIAPARLSGESRKPVCLSAMVTGFRRSGEGRDLFYEIIEHIILTIRTGETWISFQGFIWLMGFI